MAKKPKKPKKMPTAPTKIKSGTQRGAEAAASRKAKKQRGLWDNNR